MSSHIEPTQAVSRREGIYYPTAVHGQEAVNRTCANNTETGSKAMAASRKLGAIFAEITGGVASEAKLHSKLEDKTSGTQAGSNLTAKAFAGVDAKARQLFMRSEDGVQAQGQGKAFLGAKGSLEGSSHASIGKLKTETGLKAQAQAGVSAQGSGRVHLDREGLEAQSKAEATAGLAGDFSARGKASAGKVTLEGQLKGSALAGAQAQGESSFKANRSELELQHKAQATAGVKLEGSGEGKLSVGQTALKVDKKDSLLIGAEGKTQSRTRIDKNGISTASSHSGVVGALAKDTTGVEAQLGDNTLRVENTAEALAGARGKVDSELTLTKDRFAIGAGVDAKAGLAVSDEVTASIANKRGSHMAVTGGAGVGKAVGIDVGGGIAVDKSGVEVKGVVGGKIIAGAKVGVDAKLSWGDLTKAAALAPLGPLGMAIAILS